jgi:hypothetical protein
MKCLKCGAEYENNFNTCADCQVPLVADDYQATVEEVKKIIEQPDAAYKQYAPVLVPFIKHLEAVGFTISTEGTSVTAAHPEFEPLILTEYETGIIVEVWFKPTDFAASSRTEYLEFVNQFNNDVPVMRASARNIENAFVIDTWIPGIYEKDKFALFIKLMISEITGVLFKHADYSKFLTSWSQSEQEPVEEN